MVWEVAQAAPDTCLPAPCLSFPSHPACHRLATSGKRLSQRWGEGKAPCPGHPTTLGHPAAPTPCKPWGTWDGEQRAQEVTHPRTGQPEETPTKQLLPHGTAGPRYAGGTGTNRTVPHPRIAEVRSEPPGPNLPWTNGAEPPWIQTWCPLEVWGTVPGKGHTIGDRM